MPQSHTRDEAFDDVSQFVKDPSLGDDLTPETFDLDAWIAGIAPARAIYPLMGLALHIEARTEDWAKAVIADHEGDDDTADMAYIAGHITSHNFTAEQIKALRAKAPAEIKELSLLCLTLDTKARRLIPAAFLPGASD